jgi:hypothetical protein
LSHYFCQKLAFASAPPVPEALHAGGMQLGSPLRLLVRCREHPLGRPALRKRADAAAVALAPVTPPAQPHLLTTPLARKQSPRLFGSHSDAESARHFLDNGTELGHTMHQCDHPSARSPEGSGGQTRAFAFFGARDLRQPDAHGQLFGSAAGHEFWA